MRCDSCTTPRRIPCTASTRGGLYSTKCFSPAGAPFSSISSTVLLDDPLGQLARVADGGRAADEHRPAAVEGGHPLEAAHQVGQVGAEHPPVGVDLVQHDVAQALEELDPLGVVGQHPRVQHVRVGDHHPPLLARRDADRLGGVAVVGVDAQRQLAAQQHLVQLGLLVLGQGLGGEQVHRPGPGLLQQGLQHRQVVGEGLAGGGGGDQHHVPPGPHPLEGQRPGGSTAGGSPAAPARPGGAGRSPAGSRRSGRDGPGSPPSGSPRP